jgi:excisionase family DNA binding protein
MKKTLDEAVPLTVHQTARKLGIHPNTLRRHARNQTIPAVRVGNLWRFQPAVIDRILRGELLAK